MKIWWVIFRDKFNGGLYLSEQKTRCRHLDHQVLAMRDKNTAIKYAVKWLKTEQKQAIYRIDENIERLNREKKRNRK